MESEKLNSSYLSPAEVQKIFNITKVTELKWRRDGALPKPLILGKRVYYRREQIKAL